MACLEKLVFVNGVLLFGDLRGVSRIDSKELRREWCCTVSRQYRALFGSMLAPRRLTVKNIQRSMLGNCEMHSLVPYTTDLNKRIECKYCRNYRTTINRDGKVVSKRQTTRWKCNRCDVVGQPVGFCRDIECWNSWPLHDSWQVTTFSESDSSTESDAAWICVFCRSADPLDDDSNVALTCAHCRVMMHALCIGMESMPTNDQWFCYECASQCIDSGSEHSNRDIDRGSEHSNESEKQSDSSDRQSIVYENAIGAEADECVATNKSDSEKLEHKEEEKEFELNDESVLFGKTRGGSAECDVTVPELSSVKLKVKTPDGRELNYTVAKTMKIKKLMDHYCASECAEVGSIRFVFLGGRIARDSTPCGLRMKNGSVIFAMDSGGFSIPTPLTSKESADRVTKIIKTLCSNIYDLSALDGDGSDSNDLCAHDDDFEHADDDTDSDGYVSNQTRFVVDAQIEYKVGDRVTLDPNSERPHHIHEHYNGRLDMVRLWRAPALSSRPFEQLWERPFDGHEFCHEPVVLDRYSEIVTSKHLRVLSSCFDLPDMSDISSSESDGESHIIPIWKGLIAAQSDSDLVDSDYFQCLDNANAAEEDFESGSELCEILGIDVERE